MLSPEMAVNTARNAEKNNERHMLEGSNDKSQWLNPSKQLVDQAVDRWRACKLRADNTSVVVVMLDPPGPPRAQVLRKQRDAARGSQQAAPTKKACDNTNAPPLPPKPQPKHPSKGLAIISRFPNSSKPEEAAGKNLVAIKDEAAKAVESSSQRIIHDSSKSEPSKVNVVKPLRDEDKVGDPMVTSPEGNKQRSSSGCSKTDSDIQVQVNEVTSSDCEESPAKTVPAPRPAPRKSLSRELASLALHSPAPKLPARGRRSSGRLATTRSAGLAPRRRGRSIDCSATGRANESDEENAGGRQVQEPAVMTHNSGVVTQAHSSKLEQVEAKCDALSSKLRMMEKKVADKTSQLSQEVKDIKSKLDVSTPTRVLRSRNGDASVQTPASGTKRKRGENKEEDKDVRGQKRERTTTWSGLVGAKLDKQQKNGRVTRKSAGALALPGRSRRSLNILKK